MKLEFVSQALTDKIVNGKLYAIPTHMLILESAEIFQSNYHSCDFTAFHRNGVSHIFWIQTFILLNKNIVLCSMRDALF